MTSNQTPNLNKYHFLGFSLVLLFLLSFVFYQVFADSSHKRISIRKFLSFSTLKQAFNRLPNQPLDLGEAQNFSKPDAIQVNCSEFCQFFFTNLPDKTIPALIDNNGQGRLEDLELHFYDETAGLIGYENKDPNNPTFYVIDFIPKLLQTIRLNLNQQKLLSFVNYYPKTKQILFKSKDLNNQSEEFMLYSANSPSLTLLGASQP